MKRFTFSQVVETSSGGTSVLADLFANTKIQAEITMAEMGPNTKMITFVMKRADRGNVTRAEPNTAESYNVCFKVEISL